MNCISLALKSQGGRAQNWQIFSFLVVMIVADDPFGQVTSGAGDAMAKPEEQHRRDGCLDAAIEEAKSKQALAVCCEPDMVLQEKGFQ